MGIHHQYLPIMVCANSFIIVNLKNHVLNELAIAFSTPFLDPVLRFELAVRKGFCKQFCNEMDNERFVGYCTVVDDSPCNLLAAERRRMMYRTQEEVAATALPAVA